MNAAQKLDNVSSPRDTRASAGKSAEIILLDAHRRDVNAADNGYGVECAIPLSALDHIGDDMTAEAATMARIERLRRDRVALRRRQFQHTLHVHAPMGTWERLGHEVAVRLGAILIVAVLVGRWKGWI